MNLGFLFCVTFTYYNICKGFPNRPIELKAGKNNSIAIIGGNPVDIQDYPYQVLLMIDGEAKCGGSIIAETFILTAAHCIYDVSPQQLLIRVGSSYRSSGGETIQVASVTFPEDDFNPDTYDYDIAILKLATPIILDDQTAIIGLPESTDEINEGELSTATGWGLTDPHDDSLPEQLQMVQLPEISTETCSNYYPSYITPRMFCAGYEAGGHDTCAGDSGGPLAVNNILIGITSWGAPVCAEAGHPGVFTKISHFREYIDGVINATNKQ